MPIRGKGTGKGKPRRIPRKKTAIFDGISTEEMSKEQLENLVGQLKEEVMRNILPT